MGQPSEVDESETSSTSTTWKERAALLRENDVIKTVPRKHEQGAFAGRPYPNTTAEDLTKLTSAEDKGGSKNGPFDFIL